MKTLFAKNIKFIYGLLNKNLILDPTFQITSEELVLNGDFSEQGSEQVLNGDFSEQGSELISNGDFSNGSINWTLGTGWSISNTKANKLSSHITYLLQNLVLESSKTYKITFTLSNYVSGDVKFGFTTPSGSPFGTSRTSNGTYTEFFTHDSNTIALRFRASSTFRGSIDNISVVEVAPNWTLEDVWTIGDGVANGNGAHGTNHELVQNCGTINGKSYLLTYEVKNYVSGSIKTRGGSSPSRSANGVYTTVIVANGPLTFTGHNFNGSITNISVKQVGQNWENKFDSQWQFDGNKVTLPTLLDGIFLTQENMLIPNKTYKTQITTSGGLDQNNSIKIYARSNTLQHIISDGTHIKYFSSDHHIFRFAGTAKNRPISIENVSVKQIYGNWNTLNNFSIDTNQVGFIICNGRGTLIQNNILQIGINYEITIHLVNTNNSAEFFIDQLNPTIHSTDTSILKFQFTATETYLSLSSENFIGKISQITLIKN